jgi:YVTN family beta-propeller protein
MTVRAVAVATTQGIRRTFPATVPGEVAMVRVRQLWIVSLAVAVVSGACNAGTEAVAPLPNGLGALNTATCLRPRTGPAPEGLNHPSLGLRDSVALDGVPFAVAISGSGVTYVTQAHAASAARADLPATSFSASFPVGELPSQVRISPDGKTAYVANQDAHTVTILTVATNQPSGSVAVSNGSILTIGLSPDGKRLYALTDFYGVYIINTATRRVVGNIPATDVGQLLTGVAFHPFTPCMYVAARDQGVVTTIDTRTNEVARRTPVAGGRIQNVAVSLDGATLYATDIERSKLVVWDLTSDAPYREIPIGRPASRNAFDVAVTPDNAQLYVSTLADGAVYILDRATLAPVDAVATGGSARYIAFDPTGTTAVIPNEFGWVNFIGVGSPPPPPSVCLAPSAGTAPGGLGHPSLSQHAAVPMSGTPFAVAVSQAGTAYVTQAHAAAAARADLPATTFSAPFAVGDLPSQVRMSPDGQTAYVANQDARTITYVDVASNQVFGTTPVPGGSILTIGLSPDGTRLYALTDFTGVFVINTATRAVIASIPAARTGSLLTGVAFHPFAPCMFIAARDQGIVSTVDLQRNAVVSSRTVTGGRIQNVAVSGDGRTLFAADIGRSKLISWDLPSGQTTGQETAVGTPMDRNAFDVAVTPDNTQVYVSTLADGKVYVLDRASLAPLGEVATGGSARYIGFDAAGAIAVIPNESGWVDFVGVTAPPPPPPPPSACVAPSPGTAPAGSHPARETNEAVPVTGVPFGVAISPQGVLYVTQAWAASAVRADLPSTTFSAPFAVGDLPSQVRMSPDGQTAYVANQDARTITYVDVATNQATGTTSVPGGSILTIGLSPDGTRLYALTDFTGVFVINTATRTVIDAIPASVTGSLLTGVAFHPFAPCMYVAARDEGTVATIDLGTNAVVRRQAVTGARIQNVALSRDGAQLLATDIERSKLLVRNLTADGSPFLEYGVGTPQSRNAFDVAVTTDNAQVYVSTLADGQVYVFDRATRTLLGAIPTGGSARYIAFDAAGTTAVISNETGWVNFIR